MTKMTDAQFAERVTVLTAQEVEERPQPLWCWLSFCDNARPEGEEFLGVVIVKSHGFVTAVGKSHRLGINPGGETVGYLLEDFAPNDSFMAGYADRLLTREEAEEVNTERKRIYRLAVN